MDSREIKGEVIQEQFFEFEDTLPLIKKEFQESKPNIKLFNCELCPYSTNDKSNFKRHLQFKHKLPPPENETPLAVKEFPCPECTYSSNNKSNLNRHLLFKHKDSLSVNVLQDNVSFPAEGDEDLDYKPPINVRIIECQFCEFTSKWNSNMIKHMQAKHGVGVDVNANNCKYCSYVSSCRKDLRKHKKLNHAEHLKTYSCDLCSYTTNWGDSMKLHKKFHQQSHLPEVKCTYCDYFYKYNPQLPKRERRAKQLLNEHMNDEHSEAKLQCDQCERGFWTEKQLLIHKQNHALASKDGTFSCDQCDYKCKKTNRLQFHINSVHLGIKPHLCDECPAAFPTKGSLNVHKMKHTGERKFPCKICDKAFHSKQNLITHNRTHTGEKPFTCDVCGKSFSDQAYFAKHKRLHLTDESGQQVKDFVCQLCNKGFTRRSYLKYHMSSHEIEALTGEPRSAMKFSNEFKVEAVARAKVLGLTKAANELNINMNTLKGWLMLSVHPHICHLCEKAFPYEAQLRNHLKTHPEYKIQSEEYNGSAQTSPQEDKKTSMRYEASYKQEVAQFAFDNSIQDATKKYNLPHSTVNFWVKMISDPKSCHLCGKNFANDSTVRRHIEQVHKNTPDGYKEYHRKSQEISVLPFSQYLAENDLLPTEDEIRLRLETKAQQEREKQELTKVAQEILAQERMAVEMKLTNIEVPEPTIVEVKEVPEPTIVEIKEELQEVTGSIEEENTVKGSLKISLKRDSQEWHIKPYCEVTGFLPVEAKVDEDEEEEIKVKTEVDPEDFYPDMFLDSGNISDNNNQDSSDHTFSIKQEPEGEDDTPEELEEKVFQTSDENKLKGKISRPIKRKRAKRGEGGPPKCAYCPKQFKNAWKARYHEKVIHMGEFVTNCEFCGTQFKEGVKVEEHQLRMHREELAKKLGVEIPTHQCDQCEKCFNVKRDFDRHLKNSHGPKKAIDYKYICDHCGKRFARRVYLRTHELKAHGIGEPGATGHHPCPQCGHVFTFKGNLTTHIRVVHEEASVQCDECAKLFHDPRSLKRHKLQHGDPQFSCDLCGMLFREPHQLKDHHLVVHEKKPLACPPCGKEFISSATFRTHMKNFHNREGILQVHPCSQCGKTFATTNLLKAHEKRHEDQFTCDSCGAKYKARASLRAHIATIHRGERNFECDECGKNFTRQNVLKTHKMLHTALAKPYHCIYCNSVYGEKRNLVNHIGRNHPGEEAKFKKQTLDGEFETIEI